MTLLKGRQHGGDHYQRHAIQPWDAMAVWMPSAEFAGFLRGNALKYLARLTSKGDPLGDAKKALHYCEALVSVLLTPAAASTAPATASAGAPAARPRPRRHPHRARRRRSRGDRRPSR